MASPNKNLDTAKNANDFVTNKLEDKSSRAFVLQSYVFRFGIIKRIPTSFTEEEILEDITSLIKMVNVKRLNF